MQTAQANILNLLKSQTRNQHDQIEQNPLTKAIIENTISPESYALLLRRFYGFYKATEPLLLRSSFWAENTFEIHQRQRLPMLKADLLCLGHTPQQIESLTPCPNVPTLQTPAQMLGYLYVVEGSSLGGQVLSRQLSQKLGYTQSDGASYFNTYGKDNLRQMWFGFQQLLTDYTEQNPDQEQTIIEAAQTTFSTLDAWLRQ